MATTNTLGYYNPYFYAQEALIQLEKALGMAGRVYRGYDEERKSFGKGEYINIRKPGTFTAADAPATAANMVTESTQIQLAYWREVKFSLTDKELAFTSEKIIKEHIRPQAYALADDIDQKLCLLYKDIPWYHDLASPSVVTDLTGIHKILFDNKVPMYDEGNMHLMANSTLQENLLRLEPFTQYQGAGDAGVASQMRGHLGQKYGMNIFANQNVQTHTPGVSADAAGALTADVAIGATTLGFDAVTNSGTFKIGDSFVIAGNAQRYVFTADATANGSGVVAGATFSPPAVAAYSENDVITINLDTHTASLAFHRNAFALAMAPLSSIGGELGAKVASITDPVTGLSLRSRVYYVGDDSEVHVALDVLYGVKTLDPNLACRARGA